MTTFESFLILIILLLGVFLFFAILKIGRLEQDKFQLLTSSHRRWIDIYAQRYKE